MVKTDRTLNAPKFNYFSIDFNEEHSGLWGGYLLGQTNFASICIKKIISLYPKQIRSSLTIILIGHSMGGIVARGAVGLNYTNSNHVSIIFTLATPNVRPVLGYGSFLTYYESFNSPILPEDETNLANTNKIFYVSIGGGVRDIMVGSHLTPILNNSSRVFNGVSSSLTHVWSSADHLCVVWCNQLVRAVVRSLFDVYDKRLNYMNDDDRKRFVFNYHFVKHLGPASAVNYLIENSTSLSLNGYNSSFIEEYFELENTLVLRNDRNLKRKFGKYCSNRDETVFIRTNQDVYCILYHCSSSENCDEIVCDANHHVLPLSSKYIHFTLNSGICVFITASKLRTKNDYLIATVYDNNGDIHNKDDLQVGNPFWWTHVRKFDQNLAFFNLSLVGFSNVLQTFVVKLIATKCHKDHRSNEILSMIQFLSGRNKLENLYQTFRFPYNQSDDLVIRYQFNDDSGSENSKLFLFFDPNCEYELILSSSPLISLGQVIRFYYEYIPAACILFIIFLNLMRKIV